MINIIDLLFIFRLVRLLLNKCAMLLEDNIPDAPRIEPVAFMVYIHINITRTYHNNPNFTFIIDQRDMYMYRVLKLKLYILHLTLCTMLKLWLDMNFH